MCAEWSREYRFFGRIGVPTAMVLFVLLPHLDPLFNGAEFRQFENHWEKEVCTQSKPSSSGPAATASILRRFGKNGVEERIARKTFTSQNGTHPWHLSRFIEKQKLETTFHLQEPARGIIVSSLAQIRKSDGLHHIAILGNNTNGQFLVGDPAFGEFVFDKSALTNRYDFSGLLPRACLKKALENWR